MMTLKNALREFLITQQLRGNSDKTVVYYLNCVEPMIDYLGEKTQVSELTLESLREYSLYLKNRGISSNSFKTYLKGVKAYLSWLYQEGYTAEDFGALLKLPKAQRKTIDVLTPHEIESLFKCFDVKNYKDLRNCCICALMLDSGLRKSEVVSLKLDDVHIFEGYIIVTGKGNKQRLVPIGNHTKKYLIKYISQRPQGADSDSVFLTKDNLPITQSVIDRLFKTLKSRQDLLTPRIHAHLLRHTFATNYLENGGNIYALQLILGHTSLEMEKKYVHLTQSKTVLNFKNYSPLDNLKR